MYKLNYIFLLIIIFTATLFGSVTVNGTVVDESNQSPISDVNVTAGEEGTVTDKYGKFQIKTDSKTLFIDHIGFDKISICLLYTSPSPRDLSTSRMPSSA